MSESKLPPQGPKPFGVPHASKVRLYDEVARLNVPHTEQAGEENPLPKLLALLKSEHPSILQWGSDVGANINIGLGGDDEHQTNEKMAFDNAFIIAYGLIRAGYEEAGREIPGAYKPPEWYMWIRDEPEQSIGDMFTSLNERQYAVVAEYPRLVEAMQTWAAERIPAHGTGHTVGAVAIAAAEMFYAFERTEETASLERMLEL